MVAVGQVVTGGGAPHTHAWSEVTGEPNFALAADLAALDSATSTALAGKAGTGHTHAYATVESVTALDGTVDQLHERVEDLETAPPAHTHAWADITGEPSFALASDVTALDGRVDTLEAAPAPPTPVYIQAWNGSAYADATTARIFVGETDPGAMPEGSVWIGPE